MMYTSPVTGKKRNITPANIAIVEKTVKANPGLTAAQIADHPSCLIAATTVNAVFEYTPQGHKLIQKGLVATNQRGREPFWLQIKGAKKISATRSGTTMLVPTLGTTGFVEVDRQRDDTISFMTTNVLSRMKLSPRRKIALSALVTEFVQDAASLAADALSTAAGRISEIDRLQKENAQLTQILSLRETNDLLVKRLSNTGAALAA